MRSVEKRAKQHEHRSTARERQQEDDATVLANLPQELHPLFEKIKHKVRGTDRKSRTEVVPELAESEPGLVVEAMEELSQRELARLLAEKKTPGKDGKSVETASGVGRRTRRRPLLSVRVLRSDVAVTSSLRRCYVQRPR